MSNPSASAQDKQALNDAIFKALAQQGVTDKKRIVAAFLTMHKFLADGTLKSLPPGLSLSEYVSDVVGSIAGQPDAAIDEGFKKLETQDVEKLLQQIKKECVTDQLQRSVLDALWTRDMQNFLSALGMPLDAAAPPAHERSPGASHAPRQSGRR